MNDNDWFDIALKSDQHVKSSSGCIQIVLLLKLWVSVWLFLWHHRQRGIYEEKDSEDCCNWFAIAHIDQVPFITQYTSKY